MSTATTPQPGVEPEVKQSEVVPTPPPQPKKTKIPSLNPYIAPAVICPNRDCLKSMVAVMSTEKGGEPSLRYDCVPCGYSFHASLVHGQGLCKSIGQTKDGPPEVLPRGK